WIPYLNINQIIVADNEVFHDPFKKKIMRMSAPPMAKVLIKTVADAVNYLKNDFLHPISAFRTIMLVSSIEAADQAVKLGLPFNRLNLGNLHYQNGKTQISASISINRQEVSLLDDISQRGISIFVQPVPRIPPEDIFPLINKKFILP
ncbi:MAG TPA: PTS mannose/fructose/sorbose transporter subunit IIB, partial [Proteobacteria bacterium]|nr:PTS mannose/fructose/sorbose transporter subunit IIB [Pseudomonadota bacterium]